MIDTTKITTFAHSPADVARWALVQLGAASDPTPYKNPGNAGTLNPWPGFDTSEPNVPDNCVTVTDTLGHEFGRQQIDGAMWYHPGLQVRIRSQDQVTGYRKAEEIRNKLAKWTPQTLTINYDGSGSVYLVNNFNNISQVIPAGKEGSTSRRSIFTINACIVMTQLS